MKNNSSKIFNSLILSYVIFTFNKKDMFSKLKSGISIKQVVKGYKFEEKRLRELFKIATISGVIKEKNKKFTLTKLGNDLEKNKGFFTWAIGGYSPLLESTERFLEVPNTNWQPYVRGNYVAIGSDECNQGLMQKIFDKVIDNFDVASLADLGCGNAGRLVTLLKRKPNLRGVGVDINEQAIEVAKVNRKQNNLEKRLHLVCENIFTSITKPSPELKEVELVMSFMLLHDLFNIKGLDGKLFPKMKKAFPNAKYFILADTCLDEEKRNFDDMPIFTMGYELVHSLRGINLFSLSYYKHQFAKQGLRLVKQYDFGVPNTYLFILET